ncbi:DUF4238 domain-containing protein [Endobacterium cereale]|uniref:DUF4238 domain-containing protein n=1 Tax=Endobacterium cereale TaxID=2663029 RepID=UPI0030837AAF
MHHYIPIFYSKRWASGVPRMLTRYALWRPGVIAVDRKAPKGVGWELNGYSFDGFSGDEAEAVESQLMKPKDDFASRMLCRLETSGADGHWTDDERYAWTWFLVSLLVRGPEDVRSAKANISSDWENPNKRMEGRYQKLLAEFPEMRGHAHPTLKEYIASMGRDYGKRLGVKIMADMADHHEISTRIANMHWQVRTIRGGRRLLTSDRPVRRDYPFRSKNSLLTLPIGPKLAFIAANSRDAIDRSFREGEDVFVQKNNKQIVRQARQFAFAFDDSDREWVERNLAKEAQRGFFHFIRGTGARS